MCIQTLCLISNVEVKNDQKDVQISNIFRMPIH